MTLLPILLSAAAVVFAVAAFLKALSAGNASQAVSGLSTQVAGLRDALGGIAEDLSRTRRSIEQLPAALDAQGAALRDQAGILASLPSAIADALGSQAQIAEVRGTREAAQAAVSRIAELRAGQDATRASLTESVAAIRKDLSARQGDARLAGLVEDLLAAGRAQDAKAEQIASGIATLAASARSAVDVLSSIQKDGGEGRSRQERMLEAVGNLVDAVGAIRDGVSSLPVRTAEEIASRPAPAPELEELAIAVRDAGALRGDAVRSVADAVSRVSDRLEASSEEGRIAREDAATKLGQSLSLLESVVGGVREALLPLGDALRGHGEAVLPMAQGLVNAQDRFEEAAVSLRANQAEFAASVGVFTSAAQDLSSGLGAFAREGADDAARDPAALQQALLESLERLLGGFADSLRAALAEADLRHREALVEIAARLPDKVG